MNLLRYMYLVLSIEYTYLIIFIIDFKINDRSGTGCVRSTATATRNRESRSV